ncbi:MAG: YqeG family HAD IIIA-type phosphatase [Coriobacteriia bacterium]|nr:YqeG family HAD IIIA-type phosphatase [Coriobacteriia bacterium]
MPILKPDFYYRGFADVDAGLLRARGISALLVDIDNTILPRDSTELALGVSDWAAGLHREGFRVALISNNWYGHVKRISDELDFGMVSKALKPLPFAFLYAARLLGAKRHEIAVVGDQIFTDVLGGNLSGMTTVLVQPLSKADLPHTLVLRRLERRVLKGREPLP